MTAWYGLPPVTVAGFVVVIGLVLGSFVSALTWRLPRGDSVAAGRSRCPSCGTTLRTRDLVPVVSWVLAGGRCRHCSETVSPRYPLIETTTAAVLVAVALLGPAHLGAAATLALGGLAVILVALAVVDLEHGLLPDVLVLAAAVPAMAVRLLAAPPDAWLMTLGMALAGATLAVAGALALRAAFLWATGRDGLGLGDVKFVAVAGLVLPPGAWPPFLLLAGVGGVGLGLMWRVAGRGAEFPFGPALILALLVVLLVPAAWI